MLSGYATEDGEDKSLTQMSLKMPLSPDHRAWLDGEAENYTMAVAYIAFFFQARSRMNDMNENEVWEEIKRNVSILAREGFDTLGEQ